MVRKIVYAVVIFVLVTLGLILVGNLLQVVEADVVQRVGSFLKGSAGIIGFIAAVWYYFFGSGDLYQR